MSGYEYPPSYHILNHSPFEKESHFFARGEADFRDIQVNCEFEIVYTHFRTLL